MRCPNIQTNVAKDAYIPTFPICSAKWDSFCWSGVSSYADCKAALSIPYCDLLPTAKTSIDPLPSRIFEPDIKNGSTPSSFVYYLGTLFLSYIFSPVIAD